MGGNLAGTLMLAIAAFAPSRKLRVRPRTVLLGAGALGLVGRRARRAAGRRRARDARTRTPAGRRFHPELGRVIVQFAIAVALVTAAVGLAAPRASRCCAGSPSRSCSAASPSSTTRSSRRSARRTSTSATCCASPPGSRSSVGVLGEMRSRMRQRAEAAVERERRRLARELHDGVAQELAFIRRRAGRLTELPDGVEILDAAERALEDSRRAIEALVPPAHEPLDVALERLGARLATECGIEVQVNVRVATEVARRGPRRARPDHLRGRPQRRPPRRRAPRARRSRGHAADRARHRRRLRLPRRRQQRPRRRRLRPDRHARAGRAWSAGKFSLESVRGAGTLVQVVLP